MSKKRLLLLMFWAPLVTGLLREGVTLWFLIKNPMALPLRFFQLIPMVAIGVSLFSSYKLYQDGVPVISLIAPTMVHAVLIFVFQKHIVFVPFLPLIALDVIFLAFKGIKANSFPYDIDEDDDDLAEMMDLLDEAG